MEELQSQNPYAPPVGFLQVTLTEEATTSANGAQRTWLASMAVWSLVCVVSAIPSFVWGVGTIAAQQAAAMVTGVLIFIAAYVFADQLTQKAVWRRNRSLRLALKTGYITRLAISVIFPVGGLLDMFCGLFSVSIVEFFTPVVPSGSMGIGEAGFSQILATTLIQGVVLNVVLFGFVVLVFGVILIVNRGSKQ